MTVSETVFLVNAPEALQVIKNRKEGGWRETATSNQSFQFDFQNSLMDRRFMTAVVLVCVRVCVCACVCVCVWLWLSFQVESDLTVELKTYCGA